MKTRQIVFRLLIVAGVIGIIYLYKTLPIFDSDSDKQIEWVSPYEDINWETVIQAKAQFHSHTTQSDGEHTPPELVDVYAKAGFDVLAITDHWKATYPWKNYDINTEETGMVAIQGAEPSFRGPREHHIVSLFSNVTGRDMEFEQTLAIIDMVGGLASFAHPARSTERNNNETADYIYFLDNYRQIYGIDIFTRATFSDTERWPINTKLYAEIIMHYGTPENEGWRPVWMTSTDDLHKIEDIDQGFQIQLVDTLNRDHVYDSLKDGKFFWVANAPGEQPPVIKSIQFRGNKVTISAEGYDHIDWHFNDRVIHTGKSFDALKNASEDVFYVYFTAYTSDFSIEDKTGSLIGSQPFWIVRK